MYYICSMRTVIKTTEFRDFYELRISINNEYRVLLFSVDHENIMEATQVDFLNGFIKKSTKDYSKQISMAKKILENTK